MRLRGAVLIRSIVPCGSMIAVRLALRRRVMAAVVVRHAVLILVLDLGDHAAEFAMRARWNLLLLFGRVVGGGCHSRCFLSRPLTAATPC